MKTTTKMSGEERRAEILKAAQRVFVEKGFHGTTTRELAQAAGVSEALVFKHFPSKEALYTAIQNSCFDEEKRKIFEGLKALEPSTSSLVFLVHFLFSHMFEESMSDDNVRPFVSLMLRSMTDDGDFARLAIQEGPPTHWVRKVEECLKVATAAGETVEAPALTNLGGWFAHHLAGMIMTHFLPEKPLIDYRVSNETLIEQAVWFCLRGMGLKDEAIRRYYNPKAMGKL
jgi:AcrR family transcriptional regulator